MVLSFLFSPALARRVLLRSLGWLTRRRSQTMEEVRIPAAAQAPPRAGEARVPISAFSPVGQLAFKGFTSLNRIQSFVFETAYRTNENLLICAPTGAGKTNIAMMAILHCVEQHMARGVIQREEFKIVYVAPMKALAAEMTAGFGKRCAPPPFPPAGAWLPLTVHF